MDGTVSDAIILQCFRIVKGLLEVIYCIVTSTLTVNNQVILIHILIILEATEIGFINHNFPGHLQLHEL